jgi:hypothetical protein
VVSYTRITPRNKKISLRVDIYQYASAPPFKQLPNHFVNSFYDNTLLSYKCYAASYHRFYASYRTAPASTLAVKDPETTHLFA